jgi:hypothetical protein
MKHYVLCLVDTDDEAQEITRRVINAGFGKEEIFVLSSDRKDSTNSCRVAGNWTRIGAAQDGERKGERSKTTISVAGGSENILWRKTTRIKQVIRKSRPIKILIGVKAKLRKVSQLRRSVRCR